MPMPRSASAKARALARHKLLLIDLGGNWCGDCRVLAGTMDLPEVRAFVDAHYEVVAVDVGRFDKNLQIPARYGITQRLEGVPSLLIVDPASDRLIDAGHVAALADARRMTPQALADWLAAMDGLATWESASSSRCTLPLGKARNLPTRSAAAAPTS